MILQVNSEKEAVEIAQQLENIHNSLRMIFMTEEVEARQFLVALRDSIQVRDTTESKWWKEIFYIEFLCTKCKASYVRSSDNRPNDESRSYCPSCGEMQYFRGAETVVSYSCPECNCGDRNMYNYCPCCHVAGKRL